MTASNDSRALLVVVPAFNEQASIERVVSEIRTAVPNVPVVVIDDGSEDTTATLAEGAGARVLALPHHLGLGGAVQAGYRLAYELGYEYVIRVDGDGQHDPHDIPRLYEALRSSGCEMVIGSAVPGRGHRAYRLRAKDGECSCSASYYVRSWAGRCAIRLPVSSA